MIVANATPHIAKEINMFRTLALAACTAVAIAGSASAQSDDPSAPISVSVRVAVLDLDHQAMMQHCRIVNGRRICGLKVAPTVGAPGLAQEGLGARGADGLMMS